MLKVGRSFAYNNCQIQQKKYFFATQTSEEIHPYTDFLFQTHKKNYKILKF